MTPGVPYLGGVTLMPTSSPSWVMARLTGVPAAAFDASSGAPVIAAASRPRASSGVPSKAPGPAATAVAICARTGSRSVMLPPAYESLVRLRRLDEQVLH